MQEIILLILILFFWIGALFQLKNLKMYFYIFLLGSIGMFTISIIFFLPYLQNNLNILITNTLDVIAKYTNYFEVFKQNSIISIKTKAGIISIFINYECSGVIEMLVFTSLAVFFPFGGMIRKTLSLVIGNIYIFIANIIRIIFIICIIKSFGPSTFYITHTLFARILFFALMVILYYFIFTNTHLRYQKVGEI